MSPSLIADVGLSFFSLRAALRTDVPDLALYCRDLFSRFLDDAGPPAYRLELLSLEGGRWRVRDPVLDAEVDDPSWLPGIVAARLVEAAGNEVDDHDLFHAAAVSRERRGLILCGESGFGKSTLTLGLLARGWKFLSDEVAAVERDGGSLSPFPKAVELRAGVGQMLGVRLPGRARRAGKTLCDAEELFPGCLGTACPPVAVVFLDSHEARPDSKPAMPLHLAVHRRIDGLPARLAALDGVTAADWDDDSSSGLPSLCVRYDPDRCPAWRLEEALGGAGALLVASSAEESPPASFRGEPALEAIEAHRGVQLLLGRFRGRRAFARRLGEHDGFGELFLSFLRRFGRCRFYRLRVGRLERALELLERAVDG